MRILGIDPGATTGWCDYDVDARRVLECGTFDDHHDGGMLARVVPTADVVVVESFIKPHGNIYPAAVVSAITEGRLVERIASLQGHDPVLITRHDAKLALTSATQRTVVVVDDKTVWAALVLLHGEGSDQKPRRRKGVIVEAGGAIGGVTSHERAALAVAVAFALREAQVA